MMRLTPKYFFKKIIFKGTTYYGLSLLIVCLANATTTCPGEAKQRSYVGNVTTEINFINQLSEPIHIYWLNYQGKRVFYLTLDSGLSHYQPTYVTHPWVILSQTKRCLGIFYPDNQPREIVLSESAAF